MDLIKIEEIGGEPRVDSRLIANELGVDHKNTLEMIRKYEPRFEKYGKVAFKTSKPPKGSIGGRPETIAYLNEQQATFLVTLSRNSEQAVDLKQKLTESYHHYKSRVSFQIPSTYAEALLLAANQAKQLEEAQPKIEFFDHVSEANGLHNIGETAKMLGFGRNTFFAKLREMKILTEMIGNWFFEVKSCLSLFQDLDLKMGI